MGEMSLTREAKVDLRERALVQRAAAAAPHDVALRLLRAQQAGANGMEALRHSWGNAARDLLSTMAAPALAKQTVWAMVCRPQDFARGEAVFATALQIVRREGNEQERESLVPGGEPGSLPNQILSCLSDADLPGLVRLLQLARAEYERLPDALRPRDFAYGTVTTYLNALHAEQMRRGRGADDGIDSETKPATSPQSRLLTSLLVAGGFARLEARPDRKKQLLQAYERLHAYGYRSASLDADTAELRLELWDRRMEQVAAVATRLIKYRQLESSVRSSGGFRSELPPEVDVEVKTLIEALVADLARRGDSQSGRKERLQRLTEEIDKCNNGLLILKQPVNIIIPGPISRESSFPTTEPRSLDRPLRLPIAAGGGLSTPNWDRRMNEVRKTLGALPWVVVFEPAERVETWDFGKPTSGRFGLRVPPREIDKGPKRPPEAQSRKRSPAKR